MKNLLFASTTALLLSFSAQAKQIVIDGQVLKYKEVVAGSVSHTEYRTEYRDTTCSREVPDGYEERCYWESGSRECETVGGGEQCGTDANGQPMCKPNPSHEVCSETPGREVCNSEPRYRTEYYTCTQSVSVPYQVKDYDVENTITVVVEKNSKLPKGVREVIDLVQSQQSLVLNAVKTSGKVLISATQQTREVSFNGSLKRFETAVSMKLIDRQAAIGPFIGPISELTGDINELQLTTGLITDLSVLKIEIIAKKNRLIGSDPVVIQKVLTLEDMTLVNSGSQTTIKINFNKLGAPEHLRGKSAKIDVVIQALLPLENIINRQDMPQTTSVTKNLRANF